MSRRIRIGLLIIGLAIFCGSLAMLAYAYWPVVTASVQATLEPALFAPP
jgi:uncharacterized membrane protein YgdD (TMEM256/DUF423 family)